MKKFKLNPANKPTMSNAARTERRFGIWHEKLNHAIDAWGIDESDRSKLDALLGIRGRAERLLLSDAEVRRKAIELMEHKLIRLKGESNKDTKFYLATFIDDRGLTSDRTPNVEIDEIIRDVRWAMRQISVSGIAMFEMHPLANYPQGGDGRSLLGHVHAIIWTGPKFSSREAKAKLLRSGRFRCALGAKPIKLQRLHTTEDLQRVAHYIMKPPHAAKNRKERDNEPGQFKLFDTVNGYRPEFALRLAECLAQIEFKKALFAEGLESKGLRHVILKDLSVWHRARSGDVLPDDFDVWTFFARLRQDHGSANFLPFRFNDPTLRKRRERIVRRPKRSRSDRASLPPSHPGRRRRSRRPSQDFVLVGPRQGQRNVKLGDLDAGFDF